VISRIGGNFPRTRKIIRIYTRKTQLSKNFPKFGQKTTIILANNRCLLLTALGATIKSALFSLTQDWLSTIGCISYIQSQGRNHTKKGFQQPVMPGDRLEVLGPNIISLLPQLGYMW